MSNKVSPLKRSEYSDDVELELRKIGKDYCEQCGNFLHGSEVSPKRLEGWLEGKEKAEQKAVTLAQELVSAAEKLREERVAREEAQAAVAAAALFNAGGIGDSHGGDLRSKASARWRWARLNLSQIRHGQYSVTNIRPAAVGGACEPGWGGRCGSCARDYEIVKDASRRRAVTTTMPGVCAY